MNINGKEITEGDLIKASIIPLQNNHLIEDEKGVADLSEFMPVWLNARKQLMADKFPLTVFEKREITIRKRQKCTNCKKWKEHKDYYKNSSGKDKDSIRAQCKDCFQKAQEQRNRNKSNSGDGDMGQKKERESVNNDLSINKGFTHTFRTISDELTRLASNNQGLTREELEQEAEKVLNKVASLSQMEQYKEFVNDLDRLKNRAWLVIEGE